MRAGPQARDSGCASPAGLADCAPHILAQALPGISDACQAAVHVCAPVVRACAVGGRRRAPQDEVAAECSAPAALRGHHTDEVRVAAMQTNDTTSAG